MPPLKGLPGWGRGRLGGVIEAVQVGYGSDDLPEALENIADGLAHRAHGVEADEAVAMGDKRSEAASSAFLARASLKR